MTIAPDAPAGAAALTAALADMWDRRTDEILARVTVLDDAVLALLEGNLDEPRRQEAVRAAHKLAGAVGTFGFLDGSRLAREVEELLDGAEPPEARQVPRLAALVLELRDELGGAPAAPATRPPTAGSLLVVDPDADVAAGLAAAATAAGWDPEIAASAVAAREAAARRRPAAVLLDLDLPDGEDAFGLLGEFAALDLPVLVLTARPSFADRLAAARHGAAVFLDKALPPSAVVEAVRQALAGTARAAATVLAVDDDPVVLEALRALLGDAGLVVHTLEDPQRIFDVLEGTAPDVLVLDYDLPHATGAELCRALRNEPRWAALPVIFLTGHGDDDTRQRMVAAGGDGYLLKPLQGDQLVALITNRLERVRARDEPVEQPAEGGDRADVEAPAGATAVDVALVEDDEVLAPLILHALETRGHSACWLRDGREASDALTGSLAPRLVLLDWDLPGLNGLAVLGELARSGALDRTRVVMLSGHSAEADVLEAMELGAVDHVAKPFSLPVLMQRIRTELAR